MLKAKNIIIIFILNYLIILLACCFLEIGLIGSKAQNIYIMMNTAADMALEQVQATDDFFTTGENYIMDGNQLATNVNPYKLNVLGVDGKYKKVNIFEAVSGKSSLKEIYEFVYNPQKIGKYIEENPAVLNVDFTAGIVVNENLGVVNNNIDDLNDSTLSDLKTNWFKIPMLAQLGDAVHQNRASKVYKMDGNEFTDTNVVTQLWDMYDLKKSSKEMNLNGSNVEYYFTPLSVGVTYINEDLLQAFFMNNLELLMRSKYAQRTDYNLNAENCGFGVLKTAFYPELVDTTTLENQNPINNGSFTLLRGERIGSTDMSIEMYKGIMPKIEYVVIDMYDNKYNDMLQLVFGAKTSRTTENQLSNNFYNKPITGSLLKEMNRDNIDLMKNLTATGSMSVYDHKPIVIAKVTFYADFIVPYSTISLREMRGRVTDGDVGGRTLFNPFTYSQINVENVNALNSNYVDINSKTLFENYGSYAGSLYNGSTNLGSNSDAMMYTTYFAVTP